MCEIFFLNFWVIILLFSAFIAMPALLAILHKPAKFQHSRAMHGRVIDGQTNISGPFFREGRMSSTNLVWEIDNYTSLFIN